MPMIWDCSMLRDDLDMLECRLEWFNGWLCRHIVVEARMDFHGRPKPLHLEANLDRFGKWADKITYVKVGTLPDAKDPWVREHYQRDAAHVVLSKHARWNDLVVIADGDELPSASALNYTGMQPLSLMMRTCHSAVDWLYPAPQPGSVVARYGALRKHKLSEVRDGRAGYPVLADGGWHLSWLGGPEAQAEKLAVTCHLELPESEKQILATGAGYRNGVHHDVSMVPVDVDSTWPSYIYERRCPESWFRPR